MKLSNIAFMGHGGRILNLFGHPYFIARFSIRNALRAAVNTNTTSKILDVGCGNMPYRDLFTPCLEYHGLEIDQPRNRANPCVTYFYNGNTFPISNAVFDAVLCSQVLEHSFEPSLLLSEIIRVLRPGGYLYMSIPFMWPEHEQPYDSQRYTSFGLVHQLQKAGFEVLYTSKLSSGVPCLFQLLIEFVESLHRLRAKSKLLKIAVRLLTLLPYTVLNLLALPFLLNQKESLPFSSSSQEMYLDLLVVATKPRTPRPITG